MSQAAAGPPQPPFQRRLSALFTRFPITFSLIGATCAVFLLQAVGALSAAPGWICGPGDLICQWGVKDNRLLASGQWWRFVSPLFVHVSALHLFVNMYSLYALGPVIERAFTHRRTLGIYLLSGTAGVVASTAFNPHNSAGASGAIFGMLGAYAAFLFLHRDIFGQLGSAQLRRILFVALINLGLGLSPGIDNWGHFGGLICGAALAWALGPRLSLGYDPSSGRPLLVDRRPWVYVRQSAGLSAVILVMLAVVALQFAAV